MASYRDELEAMAARSDALQEELDLKRREVEELRGEGPPAARLDKLARDLAAAQAELARLRRPVKPSGPATLLILSGASLLALGLLAGLFVRVRGRTTEPQPAAVAPVHTLPFVKEPFGAQPAQTLPQPLPPPPRRTLDTAWKGHVRKVRGSSLPVGTPCEVRASLSADDRVQVDKLVVLCGTEPLYSTLDTFSGESSTSWGAHEEATPSGAFQRSIEYEDSGNRRGRNDVSVDTIKGVARIWSGGATPMEVEIAVDELDAPLPKALFASTSTSPSCKRATRSGTATEVKGPAGVKAGAGCQVIERPRDERCQVRVTCGGKVLYPDGFARVDGADVVDDEPSTEDEDPELHIAGNTVEVSDEGITTWSVAIRLE